ncbi:hypothetical protein CJF32_00010351 [Rutstroemia sp. NJR-2017a WRK4]|nr:hypothetical protein CJF32_00010351 [Rutstroemia sp. NJR-2017a WRK4]
MDSESSKSNIHEHHSGSVLNSSAIEKAATGLETMTVTENQHGGESDDDGNYLSGFAMWMLAIALMFGVFVMALDNNIIYVPSTTYGKIYTYFNVKWTYIVAVSLFELGSIVIATAQNSPAFIVGRALAGSGAAGIFSGSLIIIGLTVPLRQRPTFIAFVSSMYGVASVAGPLLGGVFTESRALTWRFCFWINLLGMVALLLALQWGGVTYPWSHSRVWGCVLAFGLLIIVFVGLQFRHEDEVTIPLRIITHRTVAASCVYSCLLAMVINTHAYYLPFYFQAIKGTGPSASGIRLLPYLVSNTAITLVTGPSISRVGYYNPFLWVGAALATVGSGLLFTLRVNSAVGQWIGYQVPPGLGVGMAVQIPFIAVQVVLPAKDMPSGSGLVGFFNALGGAISISIAQNIFASRLVEKVDDIPDVDAATIIHAGATGITSVVSGNAIALVREAYNYALTRAFILPIATGAGAFLVSFAMHWRSVKGREKSDRSTGIELEGACD